MDPFVFMSCSIKRSGIIYVNKWPGILNRSDISSTQTRMTSIKKATKLGEVSL